MHERLFNIAASEANKQSIDDVYVLRFEIVNMPYLTLRFHSNKNVLWSDVRFHATSQWNI
jgi:hypothetical protein